MAALRFSDATMQGVRELYPDRLYRFERQGDAIYVFEVGPAPRLPSEQRVIVNLTPAEWASFQRTAPARKKRTLERLVGEPLATMPEIRVRCDPQQGAYGTRWRRLEVQTCVWRRAS